MRSIAIAISVLLVSALGWAQEEQPAAQSVVAQEAAAPAPELKACKLAVKGMYCSGCVTSVESALKNVDGVADVTVDLKAGEAAFRYDPAKVRPEDGVKAVEAVGFKAQVQ